jgi:hypothetical protein
MARRAVEEVTDGVGDVEVEVSEGTGDVDVGEVVVEVVEVGTGQVPASASAWHPVCGSQESTVQGSWSSHWSGSLCAQRDSRSQHGHS